MPRLIVLNKPYDVLCQFTDAEGRRTLADCIRDERFSRFYPAGRLDRDSEGLVLLTDHGPLQHRLSHPRNKVGKTYWVQVEGTITEAALDRLRTGVRLKDGMTRPAQSMPMDPPDLWERIPPIRTRKSIPTSWLSLTIFEGRNRQVRRMTAATGYPTLRLVRYAIGEYELGELRPGEMRLLTVPR